VVFGPEKMITVPPRHYCIIENPVIIDNAGHVAFDPSGQAKLLHADQEIRFSREPFPLYPGEVLKQPVAALKVVVANCALRLKSVLDFDDDNGDKRIAGDEWLFEGPGNLSVITLIYFKNPKQNLPLYMYIYLML
jgi:major vault protein